MLNLHSFFNRYHTIEFRCFNFDEEGNGKKGGLHAGQLKAMIQLCLAMSQLAKQIIHRRRIQDREGLLHAELHRKQRLETRSLIQ